MRKNLILLLLMLSAASMMAQQLTEQEAKQRALSFLTKGNRAKGNVKNTKQLTTAKGNLEKLFAFNVEGGGYVIASGDSRTLPILGYSDDGTIDFNNMPENMRAWLKGYETAIAALGDANDLGEQDGPATDRPAVEPMIKTLWYQTFPYNNLCPVFDGNLNPGWEGKRGVTGCVATAMAMLMKFHEWPQEECKPIPAYSFPYSADNVQKDTMYMEELPAIKFDWANMIDRYSLHSTASTDTEEQQNAVAQLMQYCGQAVHMYYTPTESGAQSVFIAKALVKYFNYDPELRYVSRAFYGIDEWEDMIYSELAEGRPVFYGGFTDVGGHAFVCDGYDGEGLFHFNWGWDGLNNGYFLLSVLNPFNNESVGSSSSRLGYCLDQNAILGIQPGAPGAPDVEFDPYFSLAMDLEYDDEDGTLDVCVNHQWLKSNQINAEVALCSIDSEGNLKEHFVSQPKMIDADFLNHFEIPLDSISLDEGTVTKLYPCVRSIESGVDQWQRLTTDAVYFEAIRKEGRTFIVIKPDLHLEIADVQFSVQPVYPLEDNWLNLKIKNNGEEYSGELKVTAVYLGEAGMEQLMELMGEDNVEQHSVGAYLRSGATTEVSLPFTPSANGNVALLVSRGSEDPVASFLVQITEEYKNFYNLEVVDYNIEYPADDICLKVNLKIKNNDEREWKSNGNPGEGIYQMLEFTLDDPEALAPDEKTSIEWLTIASGETAEIDDFNNDIDIMPMASSVTLRLDQVIAKNRKRLLTVPLTIGETATGINPLTNGNATEGKWYTLKGIRIAKPNATGVYIKDKKTLTIK